MLIEDLQPADQELIKGLLRKDPTSLTDADKAILRARRDYISEKEYKHAMGEEAKAMKPAKTEESKDVFEVKYSNKVGTKKA